MKVWIAVVVLLLALYAFLATTSIPEPLFYAIGIAIAALTTVLGFHYGSDAAMWARIDKEHQR